MRLLSFSAVRITVRSEQRRGGDPQHFGSENYIRKRLHHRSDGSVDEFIRFTNEFAMKMARYSNHSGENQEMHEIFQTASSVAADILDLLNAMK